MTELLCLDVLITNSWRGGGVVDGLKQGATTSRAYGV